MHAETAWKPSRVQIRDRALVATLRHGRLNPLSWLIAQLIADNYSALIPKYVKGDFADLGCGLAPFREFYTPYAATTFLSDWSSSVHKPDFVDAFWNLNEPLPCPDARFDSILVSDVLEHLSHPRRLVRELHRILKKDGVILFNTPFLYGIHEAPYDFFRYTEFAFRDIMQEAGFEVVELFPFGSGVHAVCDLATKQLRAIPVIGAAVGYALQRSLYALGRSPFLSRLCKKGSTKFPLGYFCIVKKN
jgi:SAM-dependent methyltransferase